MDRLAVDALERLAEQDTLTQGELERLRCRAQSDLAVLLSLPCAGALGLVPKNLGNPKQIACEGIVAPFPQAVQHVRPAEQLA
jgi:hypothetical protein